MQLTLYKCTLFLLAAGVYLIRLKHIRLRLLRMNLLQVNTFLLGHIAALFERFSLPEARLS
jgi:hypothetical protein